MKTTRQHVMALLMAVSALVVILHFIITNSTQHVTVLPESLKPDADAKPSEISGRTADSGKGSLNSLTNLPVFPSSNATSFAVAEILNHPRRRPTDEVLKALVPDDRMALIAAFKKRTNLVDKFSLIVAFAHVGDDEIVELLKEALLHDYQGHYFKSGSRVESTDDPNETGVFFRMLISLGLLARHNNVAFDFLKQAAEPSFWTERIRWTSDMGSDSAGVMTALTVTAIGWSGRPDAAEFLMELTSRNLLIRTGEDDRFVRHLGANVVDAFFYLYLARKHGAEALEYLANSSDGTMESFQAWMETDEGKQWRSWKEAKRELDMRR